MRPRQYIKAFYNKHLETNAIDIETNDGMQHHGCVLHYLDRLMTATVPSAHRNVVCNNCNASSAVATVTIAQPTCSIYYINVLQQFEHIHG